MGISHEYDHARRRSRQRSRYGKLKALGAAAAILLLSAAITAILETARQEIRQLQAQLEQEQTSMLLSQIRSHFFYHTLNALQALCAFGSPEYLVSALHIQDGSSVFIHEKILTEALLSYTGEHSRLISLLLEKLDSFSVHTQLAILNYIRFCSGGYCREMFSIMEDKSRDKELRLSAIRYFGRYSYPPALERLLSFASDRDPAHWEYATVAVSSLARYRGEEVVDALKQALHSSNWYVRSAAAAGLQAQGLDYSRFMDIMGGSDRYAREMLSYQLESHSFQKAGV